MYGFNILLPTVLLLGTGFIVIFASRFLRISPVVGFIVAGIGLGPYGINLIGETEVTSFLAELGVVFLLFDIGLHFSVKSAWSLRRDLLGLAPLQLALSGLVLGTIMAIIFHIKADIAILTGLALALSSTAVVMQTLADLKQTESPVGQSAKSVLIFQDLAAIFLLIFADSLGGGNSLMFTVFLTLAKTAIAFGAAIFLGQYILSPLMKSMIRYDDPEMFTVLGLLIVMVTGLATASVGLSLTLGAFLSGMVLAETPFRVLLQTELRPFRSLLMALFFTTIGMLMDPAAIWSHIGTVISLTSLLIGIKGALVCALVFVFRRPVYQAIQLTFLLAQGSEFAFVIFSFPAVKAALGAGLADQMITAVAISMLITPFLSLFGYRWSLKVCDELQNKICNSETHGQETENQPVFIVGMNEIGKTIARGMKKHKIPYIAVEHDRKRFLEATAAGYIIAYGQPEDLRFWNTLGVRRARAICVATPHYETARKLTPVIKRIYPNLKRYVAVKDSADGVRFASLGMVPFHSYGTPQGLHMACFILREFGILAESIDRWSEDEQSAYLGSNKSTEQEELASALAAE